MAWYDIFKKGYKATRRTDGSWSYMLDPTSQFGSLGDYLNLSLTNIALFTAFQMRSTIFARAKISVVDSEGKEIENDPALELFADPNYTESQQDFLKKHLWFKSLGTGFTRKLPKRKNGDISRVENIGSLQHLIPSQVDYNRINKYSDFIISSSQIKKLEESEIVYTIANKKHKVQVKDLVFFYDIANNMVDEGMFKSPSRIDALSHELKNIQEAQTSKNKNLVFSAKWLAVNKNTEMNTRQNLDEDERQEIERDLFRKSMNATNADVNVEALANDFRKLMLDDNIASDAMRVFGAFEINKDVLNWWMNGQTTYDNKEVAIVDWIQNSIQMEADDFANTYNTSFGYNKENKKIKLTYDHLPVMQVLETKRLEGISKQAEILDKLIKAGVNLSEALRISGLDETEA